MTTPAGHGWYLYGITRTGAFASALADADRACRAHGGSRSGMANRVTLIESAGLAAVVRPVSLADFSEDVLRERLREADQLEAIVRHHNQVIDAFHSRHAILPAKFGMVYASADDVLSSLRSARDRFVAALDRLDGCDEWAVHLFASRAAVRTRVFAGDPTIQSRRAECAAARPGRAYFLQRQLDNDLDDATRRAMSTLAEDALTRMADWAVAVEASPIDSRSESSDDVEILRAALLVSRDDADAFEAGVHAIMDADATLRCESSGPWPPYSFARCGEAPE